MTKPKQNELVEGIREIIGSTIDEFMLKIKNPAECGNLIDVVAQAIVEALEVDEDNIVRIIKQHYGIENKIVKVSPKDSMEKRHARAVEELVNWNMTMGLALAIAKAKPIRVKEMK